MQIKVKWFRNKLKTMLIFILYFIQNILTAYIWASITQIKVKWLEKRKTMLIITSDV